AHEPRAEMRARALQWIFLPIFDGDHDARNDESQEQRNEKIFPCAKGVVILGVADHEIPEIRERSCYGGISDESCGSARIRQAKPLNWSAAAWSPRSNVHLNVIGQ